MISIRKSQDRGTGHQSWLETHFTFSFADYYDSQFMGFRDLRVINEDRIAPGAGFGRHSHQNMEIVTYVLDGALEHKDSLGTGSVLNYGDVQRMSAGSGVFHSEFNGSKVLPTHLLQIWIKPREKGLSPSYEEKNFSPEEKLNQLKLIVSPDSEAGSLKIHQDCRIYASVLDSQREVSFHLKPGRYAWIQMARGSLILNQTRLTQGDGASIEQEHMLTFKAEGSGAEFLLFDLA